MKRLKFKNIWLLSLAEKKGRTVSFKEDLTIIVGSNDVGKSTLIKSIYETLGCETKNHPKWRDARVKSLLEFEVGGATFKILKDGRRYALFDIDGNVLDVYSSVTRELGPALANLMDFALRLKTKSGEVITPTPAFIFLPYYIDQDLGWSKPLSSFESLQQFTFNRSDLVQYYTGIRTNKYYQIRMDMDSRRREIEELKNNWNSIDFTLRKFRGSVKNRVETINIDLFETETNKLIENYNSLRSDQAKYRKDISRLLSQRQALEAQIEAYKARIKEIEKDYQYSTRYEVSEEISCPTCGATYENDCISWLTIMQDIDEARDVLHQLEDDLQECRARIQKKSEQVIEIEGKVIELQSLMSVSKDNMSLNDVLLNIGSDNFVQFARSEHNKIAGDIISLEKEVELLERNLKLEDDKEKAREISDFYRRQISQYLGELSVDMQEPDYFERLDWKVTDTGSDLSRALLAYYYALTNTIYSFGFSSCCPIVIDAPMQQEQDAENRKKIFDFILTRRPEGSQLLLSFVDDDGLSVGSDNLAFTRKYSLLAEDEFEDVNQYVTPYLEKALSAFERKVRGTRAQ